MSALPDSALPVDRCRTCRAEILWRAHERSGKLAPIDIQPHPSGNAVLLPGNRYAIRTGPPTEGELRYISHYASCPDAPVWRKKQK